MPTLVNPYVDDPFLAPAWEQGHAAGYADPDADHLPPVAPELVGAFLEGVQAGRDERRAEPPPYTDPAVEDPLLGGSSEPERDAGGEHHDAGHLVGELVLTGGIHLAGEKLGERLAGAVGGAAGGLVALVVEVVQIPGDVALRPIEDDWEAPADRAGDTYLAICPDAHGILLHDVTSDGVWFGPARARYDDALYDARAHEHAPDAFVVLCSLEDGVCGPVAPR